MQREAQVEREKSALQLSGQILEQQRLLVESQKRMLDAQQQLLVASWNKALRLLRIGTSSTPSFLSPCLVSLRPSLRRWAQLPAVSSGRCSPG